MKWKGFSNSDRPYFLEVGDVAYYARDFVSKGGYQASEANDLINNFKKPASTRNTAQWWHKLRAVERFATELCSLMPDQCEGRYKVAAIPTSKCRTDPEYDPRFELLLDRFCALCSKADAICPIVRKVSKQALHHSDDRSSFQAADLEWDDAVPAPKNLILIDDVVTTGRTFKACQRIAQAARTDITVIGVFWAKTVWIA